MDRWAVIRKEGIAAAQADAAAKRQSDNPYLPQGAPWSDDAKAWFQGYYVTKEKLWEDLQSVMQLAVAGACQMSAMGKHAFLKDIMAIGDKYGRDSLGALAPTAEKEKTS